MRIFFSVHIHSFAVCLLAGFMALSCADDDAASTNDVPAAPVRARMTVSTRAAGEGTDDVELIRDYRVFFVEQADDSPVGTVREVVTKQLSSAVGADAFDFQLGPGSYVVYAFANIPEERAKELGLDAIEEGEEMPDLSAVAYDIDNGYTDFIPMSRRQVVTVSGRANQNFSIELIRMLAGIRFDFINASTQQLSVKRITMNPLSAGPVFLLREPNADVAPLFPQSENPVAPYSLDLPDAGYTFSPGAEAPQGSASFYFKESVAQGVSKTGHFNFIFTVQRDGAAEEELYAMTISDAEGQPFSYINRNDFITMPVRFINYGFHVDINFYPPIGGYPAAEVEQRSASEFWCVFRSGGDFALIPRLHRYDDPDSWISIYDTSRIEGTPVLTVTGDTGIFEKQPAADPTTGEILGRLATTDVAGTVCLTFEVRVKESETVTRTLTYKVYLMKK